MVEVSGGSLCSPWCQKRKRDTWIAAVVGGGSQWLGVCELHLERMKQAVEHIRNLYLFKEGQFSLEKYEDLTSLEMFTSRFAKLQDAMGEGVFPGSFPCYL